MTSGGTLLATVRRRSPLPTSAGSAGTSPSADTSHLHYGSHLSGPDVACHGALTQRGQLWHLLCADGLGQPASRLEGASGVGQRQVRQSSGNLAQPDLVGTRVGVAAQQRLSVGVVGSARFP